MRVPLRVVRHELRVRIPARLAVSRALPHSIGKRRHRSACAFAPLSFLSRSPFVLSAASARAEKETFVLDKVHSDVSFQVRHFVSKVRGDFTDFEGTIQIDQAKPEASSVVFTIKAASINTRNEGRDKHLNSPDFFDTAKFPEITFKSTKSGQRQGQVQRHGRLHDARRDERNHPARHVHRLHEGSARHGAGRLRARDHAQSPGVRRQVQQGSRQREPDAVRRRRRDDLARDRQEGPEGGPARPRSDKGAVGRRVAPRLTSEGPGNSTTPVTGRLEIVESAAHDLGNNGAATRSAARGGLAPSARHRLRPGARRRARRLRPRLLLEGRRPRLASYYLRMFAITAGFHRYFSHRTYRLGRVPQFLLAFLGQTSAQKGVLWWAANHRHHHQYSDRRRTSTARMQRGFWWSHIGWILSGQDDARTTRGCRTSRSSPSSSGSIATSTSRRALRCRCTCRLRLDRPLLRVLPLDRAALARHLLHQQRHARLRPPRLRDDRRLAQQLPVRARHDGRGLAQQPPLGAELRGAGVPLVAGGRELLPALARREGWASCRASAGPDGRRRRAPAGRGRRPVRAPASDAADPHAPVGGAPLGGERRRARRAPRARGRPAQGVGPPREAPGRLRAARGRVGAAPGAGSRSSAPRSNARAQLHETLERLVEQAEGLGLAPA